MLSSSLGTVTPPAFSSASTPRPRLAARFLAHLRKNHITKPRRRRTKMPPTMPPAIAPLREVWERVEEAEVKPVGAIEPTELVEETWAGSVEETWAGVVVIEELWTGTMTAAELGRGEQMGEGRKEENEEGRREERGSQVDTARSCGVA
jgi:hypothetical protein